MTNRVDLYGSLLDEWGEPYAPLALKTSLSYMWSCLKHEHRWSAKLSNRMRGDGCPYCSSKKLLRGFNDVNSKSKKLGAALLDVDPTTVIFRTSKKYSWKLECGHTIEDKPHSIYMRAQWCSYCSGVKVLRGFNDALTKDENLEVYWNLKKNRVHLHTLHHGSGKTYEWTCSKGHSWRSSIRTMLKNNNCNQCNPHNGTKALLKNSKLSEEWDYNKNSYELFQRITLGSSQKVHWVCQARKHETLTPVKNRARGSGCVKCINFKSSKLEQEVYEFVENIYSSEVLSNQRFKTELGVKEVDIYLPELNIGFEVNGFYWHSDKHLMSKYGLSSKEYHSSKRVSLEKLGIRLLFIWEDDWLRNRDTLAKAIEKAIKENSNPVILNKDSLPFGLLNE